MTNFRFASVLLLCAFLSSAVVAGADFRNYADNAPGTQFLERGNTFFRQGDYAAAAEYYRLAAHWADKLAQFNLGMLYVNGDGVERDPLRGWAWIRLSAERGYPKFARVANDIWDRFGPGHREAAMAILENELEPEYGDEVAIERTAREMRRDRLRATAGGSRVGANRALYVTGRGGQWVRGGEYYNPDLWDFRKIVAFETRLQKALGSGEVILRDFETVDDEPGTEPDGG
ncbi:MAG: tetratricopeptide repeat protein [Candidatus Wenzhouxiangella sp. M2_3B_020]